MTLRKISRAQLRNWTILQLRSQDGRCRLCGEPIDTSVQGRKSDYVADHDHETGEIRGILHRSCNAAEGKVANAAGRWGAKSMEYVKLIPWLESLLAYYKSEGTGVMYPDHKSPEERADTARQKRNAAAARRRALLKVKKGNA